MVYLALYELQKMLRYSAHLDTARRQCNQTASACPTLLTSVERVRTCKGPLRSFHAMELPEIEAQGTMIDVRCGGLRVQAKGWGEEPGVSPEVARVVSKQKQSTRLMCPAARVQSNTEGLLRAQHTSRWGITGPRGHTCTLSPGTAVLESRPMMWTLHPKHDRPTICISNSPVRFSWLSVRGMA